MPSPSFVHVDEVPTSIPTLRIGIIGYGFMGKTHANAYRKIPSAFESLSAWPQLYALCGRKEESVACAAQELGFKGYYTQWQDLVADPDINVINVCSNDAAHFEQTLAAVKAGKHVACEKPLTKTVTEAEELAEVATTSLHKSMTLFNYRFVPAVRLARKLVTEGRLGKLYQFRGRYLQEQGHDPQTKIEDLWYARHTGSGVMRGIGCHIIDLGRFLIGELKTVGCVSKTFVPERSSVDGERVAVQVDESNVSVVEFENGVIGSIESSCISTGRKNQNTFEINGSAGSLFFDLEDLNHLYVHLPNEQSTDVAGFTKVSVTDPAHPLKTRLLPKAHNVGWEYSHVHCLKHFIDCIADDKSTAPLGATFIDGYRVQIIMETMLRASKEKRLMDLSFAC